MVREKKTLRFIGEGKRIFEGNWELGRAGQEFQFIYINEPLVFWILCWD